jgi:hypothetical protein
VRDLLLNEFFYKVCRMYSRLKTIIYMHSKKAIKQKMARLIAEGELMSEHSEDEEALYPLMLS